MKNVTRILHLKNNIVLIKISMLKLCMKNKRNGRKNKMKKLVSLEAVHTHTHTFSLTNKKINIKSKAGKIVDFVLALFKVKKESYVF